MTRPVRKVEDAARRLAAGDLAARAGDVGGPPEVAALAKNLIMVRQNNDARPDWLQQYVALGTYVPRVFFFSPDGTLREDIKSDHPRFPYFYTPHGVDVLKRSMQAAAAGG